jgi:hypothetical protein
MARLNDHGAIVAACVAAYGGDDAAARPFIGFILARRRHVVGGRGVDVPWLELLTMTQMLIERGYHRQPDRWTPAALWIDTGNWQFKSPKRLTVSDFYPTANQLAETGILFVTVEEARRRELRGYRRGRADAAQDAAAVAPVSQMTPEEAAKDRAQILEALAAREASSARIAELEGELRRLRRGVHRSDLVPTDPVQ